MDMSKDLKPDSQIFGFILHYDTEGDRKLLVNYC